MSDWDNKVSQIYTLVSCLQIYAPFVYTYSYEWSLETNACSNTQEELLYPFRWGLAIWTQIDKAFFKGFLSSAGTFLCMVFHQSGLEALLLQLVPDPFWRSRSQSISLDAGDRWENGRNCSSLRRCCWSYHLEILWTQRHSIQQEGRDRGTT